MVVIRLLFAKTKTLFRLNSFKCVTYLSCIVLGLLLAHTRPTLGASKSICRFVVPPAHALSKESSFSEVRKFHFGTSF